MYYASKHSEYGCDQDLMIKVFTKNEQFTKNNFLDYHGYFQDNVQTFPCNRVTDDQLSTINISDEKKALFQILSNNKMNNWPGEPVDCRGKTTIEILSLVKNINLDNFIKDYYRI